MMKKVNFSQLLSRSPRLGGRTGSNTRRDMFVVGLSMGTGSSLSAAYPHASDKSGKKKSKSGSNGEVADVTGGTLGTGSNNGHYTNIQETSKKKGKTGILQSLKKKISGKLDTCQASRCSSPKKSKSFEGLSNSFGDSFSQSISEESSSDGLNTMGQSYKSKHSKRAIRPMHTPVTRQNSSNRVLSDCENDPDTLSPDQPQTALSLYTNLANRMTDTKEITMLPITYDDVSVTTETEGLPKVSVECIEGVEKSAGCQNGGGNETERMMEMSSPTAYGEIWGPSDSIIDASKRSLAEELFHLARFGWYWGPITRAEAEEKLLDQPDGAFLVRDSSDDKYLLSLSFRSYNKTLHTRIEHSNGWFSFYPHPEHEGHTSLVGLIDHCMSHSESGVFCYSRARAPGSPSFPVRLTKPVSRFTQVRSLQYLCRFVIRQYTRVDHIQALPLPTRIKGYLEEGHY